MAVPRGLARVACSPWPVPRGLFIDVPAGVLVYCPGMEHEPRTALAMQPLEPPARPGWLVRHLAGVVCCALGLAAVTVTALVHFGGEGSISKLPDVRLTLPFLIAALAAGVAAFVRREGAHVLPLSGVGLAAAAMVLGWALVLAVIAGLTLLAILILSEMM